MYWFYKTFVGVLKELLEAHDDERLSGLCDQTLQLLEDPPNIDCTQKDGRALIMQLYTSGITLWNKTVALKSAGAIALSLNAQSEEWMWYCTCGGGGFIFISLLILKQYQSQLLL